MKYILGITSFIFLFLASNCAYSQQYDDVVYLKNGSIIHGIILEQKPDSTIRFKTSDGNIFVFKMDEIEKLSKEKSQLKAIKDSIKSKSTADDTKIKTAGNSLTIQPIGLLTLLSNIEYDRAISGSFSVGLKISFMTFFLRQAITFEGNEEDVENAEKTKQSLSAWGIGGHIRLYTGGRAVEGFFIGIAGERLAVNYDEINDKEGEPKTVTNRSAELVRLELEIGDKIKLSNNAGGFTILWTLGAGAGFVNNYKNENSTIPLGSIGFGIGYSF